MIKFKTINVDGKEVERVFDSIESILNDWNSENGTTLPSLDDDFISGEIEGESVSGKIFNDFFDALSKKYNIEY